MRRNASFACARPLAAALSPLPRIGAERGNQLRHHLDRIVGQPEDGLAAAARRHAEAHRHQGQRVLRARLRRRHRRHALQQGPGRLVRQQVRRSRRWTAPAARCSPRWSTSTARQATRADDRAQGQPANSLDDVLKKRARSSRSASATRNSTCGFAGAGLLRVRARQGSTPRTRSSVCVRANHETNMLAVANKQIDVATVNSDERRDA